MSYDEILNTFEMEDVPEEDEDEDEKAEAGVSGDDSSGDGEEV